MENTEEPVKWTVELEVALFRSMSGHKPVGEWIIVHVSVISLSHTYHLHTTPTFFMFLIDHVRR